MHRRSFAILMLAAVAALAAGQARADLSVPAGFRSGSACTLMAQADTSAPDDAAAQPRVCPTGATALSSADLPLASPASTGTNGKPAVDSSRAFSTLGAPEDLAAADDLISSTPGQPGNATPAYRLPPPPSSTKLFLSAFASLGAWQILRSAKDFKLANVPAWYHTDAPARIGQAVPFDFQQFAMPLVFPAPAMAPLASHRMRVERIFEPLTFAHLTLPECRGPPMFVPSC